MRARRFIVLATIVFCVCSFPASAQPSGPARTAVTRLTAGLGLADALRGNLEAEMVRELGGDGFRYDPANRSYTVMECPDTEVAARLVNLNGDATPEVYVEALGMCVGGMAGSFVWLFVRAPSTGAWNMNLGFNGGVVPLANRAQGHVDLMVAGPGFCHGIWRWNSREYAFLCNAQEGPAGCERVCPNTVQARISGDELPAFTLSAPRRP